MSGDNLPFHLPVKFSSEEMTETKKIFHFDQKFEQLDEIIENISEPA